LMQTILKKLNYKMKIIDHFLTHEIIIIEIKLVKYIRLKTNKQYNNVAYNTIKKINKY